MALPPMSDGAVQETRAEALAAVAVTPVGLAGTGAGVTGVEGSDAGPVPASLVALTVNVYGVPLVRPDTVQESGPLVQPQVWVPSEAVTV